MNGAAYLRREPVDLLRPPSNSLEGGTFSALAISASTTIVGLRMPRSTPLMYVRYLPQAKARSSWEKPRSLRRALSD